MSKRKLSLSEIREYWTSQARAHGQSPAASWSDHFAIDLEVREVLKHIRDGQLVLDAGCANGYTTVQLASQTSASFRGIDYVAEMIDEARQRLAACADRLPSSVDFAVGNVMELDEPINHYDTVISIRVIINLGNWENQLIALRECVRVLKPRGSLLLSGPTTQGWSRLNQLRNEWGLGDIPIPAFNNYLDEDRVQAALADQAELVEIANFASTYAVGTRLLKPLLAALTGDRVDVADPDMEWNRWFSQLPAWGDYGTQKLMVLRKRP